MFQPSAITALRRFHYACRADADITDCIAADTPFRRHFHFHCRRCHYFIIAADIFAAFAALFTPLRAFSPADIDITD
jgi:hypothetical protein